MANYIGFLRGVAGIPTISAATGIRASRLRSYMTGNVRPNLQTLTGLRKVYRQVQVRRLMTAGLPYQQARKLGSLSNLKINNYIGTINRITSGYAKSLGIDQSVIRDRFSHSDKTYTELTNENYAEYVQALIDKPATGKRKEIGEEV